MPVFGERLQTGRMHDVVFFRVVQEGGLVRDLGVIPAFHVVLGASQVHDRAIVNRDRGREVAGILDVGHQGQAFAVGKTMGAWDIKLCHHHVAQGGAAEMRLPEQAGLAAACQGQHLVEQVIPPAFRDFFRLSQDILKMLPPLSSVQRSTT